MSNAITEADNKHDAHLQLMEENEYYAELQVRRVACKNSLDYYDREIRSIEAAMESMLSAKMGKA